MSRHTFNPNGRFNQFISRIESYRYGNLWNKIEDKLNDLDLQEGTYLRGDRVVSIGHGRDQGWIFMSTQDVFGCGVDTEFDYWVDPMTGLTGGLKVREERNFPSSGSHRVRSFSGGPNPNSRQELGLTSREVLSKLGEVSLLAKPENLQNAALSYLPADDLTATEGQEFIIDLR